MTYDPVRQRTLLTGGRTVLPYSMVWDDVWEFDGNSWKQIFSVHSPNTGLGTEGHSLAFDRRRSVLVQLGGLASGNLADIWEWDGVDWTHSAPRQPCPSSREDLPMVYDEARQRALVYAQGTTWEWDGTAWSQRFPAHSPAPGRSGAALAYDSRRAVVVLFGGSLGATPLADTWEWDGQDWRQRTTTNTPPARLAHALAYDSRRGRVVLFGGWTGQTNLGDTWEYDGTDWIQPPVVTAPLARGSHGMAYDAARGRTVLHGGVLANGWSSGDTWEWDGTRWTLKLEDSRPRVRAGQAMASDAAHDRVVMFGGYFTPPFQLPTWSDDTWELVGGRWRELMPAVRPAARARHALASLPGGLLLFGGVDSGGEMGDSWRLDGGQWAQVSLSAAPAPRHSHAMAAAPGGTVVLFGGARGSELLGDTWRFDGQAWHQSLVTPSPSPRRDHVLVTDPVRGRTLLFGGLDQSGVRADTWEWDGQRWTERQPQRQPTARMQHAAAFDGERRRVVVFGGVDQTYTLLRETWEWDGADWTPTPFPVEPIPRTWHAMAKEPASGQIVLYGGTSGWFLGDTWRYSHPDASAFQVFGEGCAGTNGSPALASASGQGPWLGESFTTEVRGAPAGQLAVFVTGLSRTMWQGIPLPLDLTSLGMPGCTLWVSVDVAQATTAPGGTATWTLPICACPELLHAAFFQQALIIDPGANALGVTVSNGGAARIGAR